MSKHPKTKFSDPTRNLLIHLDALSAVDKEVLCSPQELEKFLINESIRSGTAAMDRSAQIALILKRVTPMQRRCVVLYLSRGFSITEIAKILELDRSTVRTHLQRSLGYKAREYCDDSVSPNFA